ncbi:hypothetical protein D9M69_462630 [compost metagenome]
MHGAGVVLAGDDLADAVDVAADQVAAEARGRRQRLLQVDPAAGLEVDEGGARQGLAADVGPEAVAGQLDGGQAHAVDGDAVAELDVGQVELAGGDLHADVAAFRGERADAADGFDYAGEHGSSDFRQEVQRNDMENSCFG